MSDLTIHYRDMVEADIPAGLRLCRASRWNQTGRDWELFLRLSPRGRRVAVKDERVIGTVATVRYENRFGWIGMALVDPAERGRGVGSRLISEALDALKGMPSIRLDATPAGHPVYRKLDFVDEYRLSRMEAAAPGRVLTQSGNPARPMTREDLSAVANFDREVFGADRRLTLDASHHESDWRAWLESIGFREQRPFIRMFYLSNPYPGLPPKQFGILGPEFG